MKKIYFLLLIVLIAFILRFFKLNQNPPSLYWEEVALGYDAYSLLKTGRDHRGNSWPVAYLKSYMDYKPPFYVYTTIPSVAIFGLNEFAVRFPSAFFGSLTVLIVYFLTKEIFKSSISLTASFLLAISPWHLQFSRAAFEVNLALFLITTAVWLFLKSLKKHIFLPISALFFTLSLYTYHGARIFIPLIVLTLSFIFFKKLWSMKVIVIFSLIIGLAFSFPIINLLRTKEGHQRFQETSAFTTLGPILESNNKIQEDGGGRIAKLIHHRFWEYLRIFLDKYGQHFNGSYLFLNGDNNPRHSTGEFGILYHWELITFLLGLVIVLKNPKKEHLFVLFWFLITPVPAAITKATPHALRTIFGLPAFILISSLGVVKLLESIKKKKVVLVGFVILIIGELFLYLHFYYDHYPKIYSSHWQYGYKQAIEYLKDKERECDYIYISNNYGRAYMYYLFYSKMDPYKAQQLIAPFRENPDIPYLENVLFSQKPPENKKVCWIGTTGEFNGSQKELVKKILFLDGNSAFSIWETR